MNRLGYQFDVGPRGPAAKARSRDCAVRAIAIATNRDYRDVHHELGLFCAASKARKRRSDPDKGVFREHASAFLETLGWRWVATSAIGAKDKTHLNADELPAVNLIARVSRHYTAVVDGVIRDISNPDRYGKRLVYGYWVEDLSLRQTCAIPCPVSSHRRSLLSTRDGPHGYVAFRYDGTMSDEDYDDLLEVDWAWDQTIAQYTRPIPDGWSV